MDYQSMLAVALAEARLGLKEAAFRLARRFLTGRPVDWRGTQSAGAAGRSIVAWRDGAFGSGPAEELSEIIM